MKKGWIFSIFVVFCWVLSTMAMAGTTHEGHDQKQMPAKGAFEHQAVEKGVRGEFQIMSLASMNMKDPKGNTHHIMVKLFRDEGNHPIKEAIGKIKVIGPDGKEQINGLKDYQGILAANFTFHETGKYGVICLVKVDGEKHLYKFWYPHE